MPVKEVTADTETKMKKAVEVLQDQLKGVRTGRASTGLVENIKVEYYGSPTPLKQIAMLAAPQADTVIIKPFDSSSIKDIDKAIRNSDLSLAPVVEGKIIRISVPPLSEDRRKQLAGQVRQFAEQSKISIRNIRRDAVKHLEQQKEGKTITEDDLENGKKQIDDVTKEYSSVVDKIVKTKTDEIMLQ